MKYAAYLEKQMSEVIDLLKGTTNAVELFALHKRAKAILLTHGTPVKAKIMYEQYKQKVRREKLVQFKRKKFSGK